MDINLLFIAYARFDNIRENLDSLDLEIFTEIFIYIDGPKNPKINQQQIDFLKNIDEKIKVKTHKKNLGVRGFIPYAISDAFKYSENLLILEDDIIINNVSIDFIKLNYKFFDKHILSLFNPIELNSNFIIPDGGIWGWCVSKSVWSKFDWYEDDVLEIFTTLFKKLGLMKSLYFAPLVYLSKNNKIKSWAYNWLYIRILSDIDSIIPHKTMSINMGLGDLFASSSKRAHKFSDLKLSNEINPLNLRGSVPLNLMTGYTNLEVFLRIFYNWFRVLKG